MEPNRPDARGPVLRVLRGNPTEDELAALLVALAALGAGTGARQDSTTAATAAGRTARPAVRGLRTPLRPGPGSRPGPGPRAGGVRDRPGRAHRIGAVRMLSERWSAG